MRCRRHKKAIRGSTILESMMAMFVIFLVLLGLLQIFYFAAGQLFADYAAFRGVRSHIVGFREYLVKREVRVNAIGGSGQIVEPAVDPGSFNHFATEKSYINTYLNGYRWLEYEHWFGARGQVFDGFKSAGHSTTLTHAVSSSGGLATLSTKFSDYALLILSGQSGCCSGAGKARIHAKYIPEKETSGTVTNFLVGDIDVKGSATMMDHSGNYLDYDAGGS